MHQIISYQLAKLQYLTLWIDLDHMIQNEEYKFNQEAIQLLLNQTDKQIKYEQTLTFI